MIKVFRDLQQLPVFNNAVLTIGTFDGVHTGHQQIIRLLKEAAATLDGESVIITFYPHPRKVVAQDMTALRLLTTLEEKIMLLDKMGVENLVVIPFDSAFANQTAEEYVAAFLVDKFHPHTVIIGYDHRFGHNRSGDYRLLEKLGEQHNYVVKEIPEHMLNEVTVSSTRIRQALQQSDVQTANELLGYDYFFEGKVVEGNKLGRTIGYPTANLFMEDFEKLVPGNGVYAVTVQLPNESSPLNGMMNIGVRPTVNGSKLTVEVNIFDFDQQIYGEQLRVNVKAFLRSEIKFAGLDQLKAQLAMDADSAMHVLSA